MPGRPWLPVVLAVLVASAGAVAASVPGMRIGGVAYAPADAVARALGDIVAAGEGSLTWRSAAGTLTVFEGSPDALWQARDATGPESIGLSAPVVVRAGRWWLPLDALDTLGIRVSGTKLTLPDGRDLTLALPAPAPAGGDGRSRVDDLGNGVRALRLFPGASASGADAEAGPAAAAAAVSAMVADLDMIPLIDPGHRAAIDAALEGSAPDKPLLVVVTALRDSSWEASFTLTQHGRSLEFRYPYRMRLVEGSPRRVGPDAPASMLLLLPAWFNLYEPIVVAWQGVKAGITFRR